MVKIRSVRLVEANPAEFSFKRGEAHKVVEQLYCVATERYRNCYRQFMEGRMSDNRQVTESLAGQLKPLNRREVLFGVETE